ncbi:SDR family NAD(P)-dependent oxidoreductase [Embleya sp. NPDC055664]
MNAKTAVVTGGNQGLGFALVRGLCRELPPGSTVYLCARDARRGADAVAVLRAEGLAPELAEVDVRDDGSVAALAEQVRSRHGAVDVVVGNAAARISPDASNAAQVRAFVDTNNHGTVRLIEAFTPLLADGARFVVVASSFGRLRNLPQPLRPLFDTDAGLSLVDLEHAMDGYVDAVEQDRAAESGWPDWINVPSKVGQVAAVRILARDLGEAAVRRDILVNAACPGLVDTDASRPWFDAASMADALSPDDAARDVLWLATLSAGTTAPHGELVQYRKVLPFRS